MFSLPWKWKGPCSPHAPPVSTRLGEPFLIGGSQTGGATDALDDLSCVHPSSAAYLRAAHECQASRLRTWLPPFLRHSPIPKLRNQEPASITSQSSSFTLALSASSTAPPHDRIRLANRRPFARPACKSTVGNIAPLTASFR